MKIHQLPMGARFEYEGEEYVKTGPLFAQGKNGQRLIPKYAILTVADGAAVTEGKAAGEATAKVSRDVVTAAFDTFYARCRAWVPDEHQASLEEARKAFFASFA